MVTPTFGGEGRVKLGTLQRVKSLKVSAGAHDLLLCAVHVGAPALDDEDRLLLGLGRVDLDVELGDQRLDFGALLPHNLRHDGGALHRHRVQEELARISVRVVVGLHLDESGHLAAGAVVDSSGDRAQRKGCVSGRARVRGEGGARQTTVAYRRQHLRSDKGQLRRP